MVAMRCDEIVLEAEVSRCLFLYSVSYNSKPTFCLCMHIMIQASNQAALNLYEKLGFFRDEKLKRYYLNGGDAFRLKLWIDNDIVD